MNERRDREHSKDRDSRRESSSVNDASSMRPKPVCPFLLIHLLARTCSFGFYQRSCIRYKKIGKQRTAALHVGKWFFMHVALLKRNLPRAIGAHFMVDMVRPIASVVVSASSITRRT